MSSPQIGPTEFQILRASHKFLREDERPESKSWNEQLAEKYYASLYREFAVCDLKHYKSGNFALRWRTEDEVISGAGETTCANTRCEYHRPPSSSPLTTLELPFAYEEHGEQKAALVKVVLCDRCVHKLMWKRNKEKEKEKASKSDSSAGKDQPSEVRDRQKRRRDERYHPKRRERPPHSRSRSPPSRHANSASATLR